MGRIPIWLLAFLGTGTAAFAQHHFDSWTTDNGLPHNSINAMLQSRNGYLWLTTPDGLVRFDGVRFTNFTKSNTPGIKSNRFTAIYEDRDGTLWIGTESAGVTRYRDGTFTTFPTDEWPGHELVRGIAGDEAGHLWVLLNNHVIQWTGDRFVSTEARGFPTNPEVSFGFVHKGAGGGFWSFGDDTLALFARGKVTTVTRREGLPAVIDSIADGGNGTVWIAGRSAVSMLRNRQLTTEDLRRDCVEDSGTVVISSATPTLVCRDHHDNLLLIGLESGEHRVLGPAPPRFPFHLLSVNAFEDREGTLWIGTGGQGLYRARKHIMKTFSKEEGLRDRNIYPVFQDHAGAIWLGAWPANLTRLKDGVVTNYSKAHGLSGEPTTALYEDRDHRLWVGAYGGRNGLRVLQDGRFLVPDALRNLGLVKAIYQDRDGGMWFGTEDRLLRYEQGRITGYSDKDGLAGNSVHVILQSANGDLWFGGTGGLTRLRGGTFTAYTERNGLPSAHVRALYEDSDAVLWIGTYDGGLARFKDDRFTHYTTRQGLFDDAAFQILEDDHANLWMSCNRGIYRVSRQDLNDVAAGKASAVTSIAYGKSDGMRSSECNGGSAPAGIRARDGTLWFPTQDGVVRIDPARLPSNPAPPPVRVESCRVDRNPVSIAAGVRLRPGQNSFEVEYTALSFINSDRIRFKYKLEGLDSDWVDAATRRTAYYSHVPPGNYTFRVVAANSDGIWNDQGDALRFAVLPPFYRTVWFSMLVCTIAACLLYLAWHNRVSRLKRANAMQQAFSRRLIDSQENERKRIASELHDSLGQHLLIIKNRAALGERFAPDAGRMTEQFGEITASASQAINEVRAIAHNLRPLNLERLGLTAVLEEMVEKVTAASSIQFSADIAPLDGLLAPEAEINVYRIVQESINNIIKHSQATRASVEVWRADGWVHITVRDNGCGGAESQTASTESPRSGLGLTSIAERVQMLGGTQAITSIAGQGTAVTIRIPVQDSVASGIPPGIAIEPGPIG